MVLDTGKSSFDTGQDIWDTGKWSGILVYPVFDTAQVHLGYCLNQSLILVKASGILVKTSGILLIPVGMLVKSIFDTDKWSGILVNPVFDTGQDMSDTGN